MKFKLYFVVEVMYLLKLRLEMLISAETRL